MHEHVSVYLAMFKPLEEFFRVTVQAEKNVTPRMSTFGTFCGPLWSKIEYFRRLFETRSLIISSLVSISSAFLYPSCSRCFHFYLSGQQENSICTSSSRHSRIRYSFQLCHLCQLIISSPKLLLKFHQKVPC